MTNPLERIKLERHRNDIGVKNPSEMSICQRYGGVTDESQTAALNI